MTIYINTSSSSRIYIIKILEKKDNKNNIKKKKKKTNYIKNKVINNNDYSINDDSCNESKENYKLFANTRSAEALFLTRIRRV